MNTSIPKCLNINPKIIKIKTLMFFVLIFFVANSNAQNRKHRKQKQQNSKQENLSGTPNESEKLKNIASKDSVKKPKIEIEEAPINFDSIFIGTGTFKLFKKSAHASYYADKFHNRKTANGKRYDKNKLTAAHKKLPFGTKVKVTNEANGKSVIVEINDRGPFVKSRDIDLSRRAFMYITGNKSSGGLKVTLEILDK